MSNQSAPQAASEPSPQVQSFTLRLTDGPRTIPIDLDFFDRVENHLGESLPDVVTGIMRWYPTEPTQEAMTAAVRKLKVTMIRQLYAAALDVEPKEVSKLIPNGDLYVGAIAVATSIVRGWMDVSGASEAEAHPTKGATSDGSVPSLSSNSDSDPAKLTDSASNPSAISSRAGESESAGMTTGSASSPR